MAYNLSISPSPPHQSLTTSQTFDFPQPQPPCPKSAKQPPTTLRSPTVTQKMMKITAGQRKMSRSFLHRLHSGKVVRTY